MVTSHSLLHQKRWVRKSQSLLSWQSLIFRFMHFIIVIDLRCFFFFKRLQLHSMLWTLVTSISVSSHQTRSHWSPPPCHDTEMNNVKLVLCALFRWIVDKLCKTTRGDSELRPSWYSLYSATVLLDYASANKLAKKITHPELCVKAQELCVAPLLQLLALDGGGRGAHQLTEWNRRLAELARSTWILNTRSCRMSHFSYSVADVAFD